MQFLENLLEFGGIKKDVAFLIISGAALLLSIFNCPGLPFDPAWIAILFCGIPIILEAINGLVSSFDIRADVLVSIALIASIVIGEEFAAGEIAFIMQLGALLEEVTVARARSGIAKLVDLTPLTARLVDASGEKIIPVENVRPGDILRVNPGEIVPVDGIITNGETSINQATLTGESLPVDKRSGDEVFSGTINQFGSFEMKAEKTGADSSIQRMISLVESADAGKTKIVRLADKWATWIVIGALSTAIITFIVTQEINRSVAILVVFCPCSLVLATPTAIMAAIGNATRHEFLTRQGDALERLASVDIVAFDKTGTLTFGAPEVVAIQSFGIDKNDLLCYAASSELHSEHPLGKAIVKSYSGSIKDIEQFKILPGSGVLATVDGKKILAGNSLLFSRNNILLPPEITQQTVKYTDQGCTIIFIAIDGIARGFLALADAPRPSAISVIKQIKESGFTPELLTGDNRKTADNIATQLGISEVYSDCLPEDKFKLINKLQAEGSRVCMIGDGINDALALKTAYVSIAMGAIGSDIAVEAADIVLVSDNIKELPHILKLAKRTMLTIKCNLAFSMLLNFVAIILAIVGILDPVVGALVHNAGSVFVVANSALLLKWK